MKRLAVWITAALFAFPAIQPAGAARHDEWRGRLEDWAASAAPLESRFEPSQRQETIERLRALGYLGGGDE